MLLASESILVLTPTHKCDADHGPGPRCVHSDDTWTDRLDEEQQDILRDLLKVFDAARTKAPKAAGTVRKRTVKPRTSSRGTHIQSSFRTQAACFVNYCDAIGTQDTSSAQDRRRDERERRNDTRRLGSGTDYHSVRFFFELNDVTIFI